MNRKPINSICLVSNSYETNQTLKTDLVKKNIEIKIIIEKIRSKKKCATPKTLKRGALKKNIHVLYIYKNVS